MEMRLDHVNLSVRNLEESLGWYEKVFDFVEVERSESNGVPYAVIRSDGGHGESMLCIYQYPEERTLLDRWALREKQMHGPNHFALRITDREKWEQKVRKYQLELLYDGPNRWPNSTAWYFCDPTGYEWEVTLWDDNTISFEGVKS